MPEYLAPGVYIEEIELLAAHAVDDVYGGVCLIAYGKKNFIRRIVLHKEAAQTGFQLRLSAAQWFEQTKRRPTVQRSAVCVLPLPQLPDADTRDYVINQSAERERRRDEIRQPVNKG